MDLATLISWFTFTAAPLPFDDVSYTHSAHEKVSHQRDEVRVVPELLLGAGASLA